MYRYLRIDKLNDTLLSTELQIIINNNSNNISVQKVVFLYSQGRTVIDCGSFQRGITG